MASPRGAERPSRAHKVWEDGAESSSQCECLDMAKKLSPLYRFHVGNIPKDLTGVGDEVVEEEEEEFT